MNLSTSQRIYMLIAGLTGWTALILQFYLMVTLKDSTISTVGRIFNYFSYFTILTNIIVALSFTVPLIASRSRLSVFFTNPVVQSAITFYIMIVGLIYSTILQQLWQPQGAQWLADVLLHYVMPLAYVFFWLLFVPQGSLKWKHALSWLLYPALYFLYSIIRGAITQWYPYPFVDAKQNGYAVVFRNAGVLFLAFLAFACLFIALDKFFSRPASKATQRQKH